MFDTRYSNGQAIPKNLIKLHDAIIKRLRVLWKAEARLDTIQCPHPREQAVISESRIFCGVCRIVLADSQPNFSAADFLKERKAARQALEAADNDVDMLRAKCPHPKEAKANHPEHGDFCQICEEDWEILKKQRKVTA